VMPKQPPSQPTASAIQKPVLVILSGPSGVGKDAVLARMKETGLPLHYVVTVTTRPQRPLEKNNVDYHFVNQDKFMELQKNNELLESANVYGNWYGVPRKDVVDALRAGQDTIVKVDVQGAENIKKVMPQAVTIFLSPPSREDLRTRLKKRSTESTDNLTLRLESAESEFEKVPIFDYVVVNSRDGIDRAVSDIAAIITTEKCRPSSSSQINDV
jgi:guanylate kinase